ncbi:MAG: helix-turn-helix transcriptional regulator [Fibrobacterota bacterium]
MYVSTLQIIMKARGLNQSDISRIAGVSRQSVSLWLSHGSDFQNIQILHLIKLSSALNISIDVLARPMPLLSDPDTRQSLFAEFCWDFLFPDIDTFFVALVKHQLPALGRLVACRGLFESAYLLGSVVWKGYPDYCKYIHPAKKKECDYLWNFHKSRMSD